MSKYSEIHIDLHAHIRQKHDHAKEAKVDIFATDEETLVKCFARIYKTNIALFDEVLAKARLESTLKDN